MVSLLRPFRARVQHSLKAWKLQRNPADCSNGIYPGKDFPGSTFVGPVLPKGGIHLRMLSALSAMTGLADHHESEGSEESMEKIRDVAIIAHVDHGKTTLMDRLLRHCGASLDSERVMDSMRLEQERGITIASKYTSVTHGTTLVNLVDTPGHADFGGEVERVLSMVDGAILLVDCLEGPLAQTKFVLAKALRRGFCPIVVCNKADRPTVTAQRVSEVEADIFDLFASLNATDEQLDFPLLYASAKEGWVSSSLPDPNSANSAPTPGSMSLLLDTIVKHVPPPSGDPQQPFQMLVSMMEKDPYLGRILTGRIANGTVRVGDAVHALRCTGAGATSDSGKVVKIMKRRGTSRVLLERAQAGDIVSIAGLSAAAVTDTLSSPLISTPLPTQPIDPPTIAMTFAVNDSPLSGRDGTQRTGTKIGERLAAEAESNVSITVRSTPGKDAYEVQGRGELQLGILIESMRREGFEMSVSPPVVMYREENGKRLEPVEEVVVEVDDQFAGAVIEGLSLRRAELTEMIPDVAGTGKTRLCFTAPSRGLLGYRAAFASDTHGTGLMHRSFLRYEQWRGPMDRVRKGALVSMAGGTVTAHALSGLEARGILFVQPQLECYDGMIIGEHSREGDLEVNPVRAKQLTNMRASGTDEAVRLAPPRQMSLEEAIGWVQAGELIEVTPKTIRLRKRALTANERKSVRRSGQDA